MESGARSRPKQQQQPQLSGIASAPAGPGVPPFFLHCTQPGPWVAEGVVCGRGSEPSGPDRRLGRPKKERGQKAGATRKNQRRVARRCCAARVCWLACDLLRARAEWRVGASNVKAGASDRSGASASARVFCSSAQAISLLPPARVARSPWRSPAPVQTGCLD